MERKQGTIGVVLVVLMCLASVGVGAPAAADATGPSGPRRLTLRVVGPHGQAVAGAKIGTGLNVFENSQGHPPQTIRMWLRGGHRRWPFVSDGTGRVVLADEHAAHRQFYALYEPRGWVGYVAVDEAPATGEVQVSLEPACHVQGWLGSSEFEQLGLTLLETVAFVYDSQRRLIMYFVSERGRCEFLLPSGTYWLEMEGSGPHGMTTRRLERELTIAPGQAALDLGAVDLPATRLASLLGQPAPELEGVKAWLGGGEVSLGDVRGRPVVLTFWGSWCEPGIRTMRTLMDLYDEFEPMGVVFVAVHDTTIQTTDKLQEKLIELRTQAWQGRGPPFALALDTGEKSGAVHAAYGVRQWPTTVLIGRDGKLAGQFSPQGGLRPQLQQMLRLSSATGK